MLTPGMRWLRPEGAVRVIDDLAQVGGDADGQLIGDAADGDLGAGPDLGVTARSPRKIIGGCGLNRWGVLNRQSR